MRLQTAHSQHFVSMSSKTDQSALVIAEGVQMHSFSDQSGCVFYCDKSGETLSVKFTYDELVIRAMKSKDFSTDEVLTSLLSKGFIQRFSEL